MKSGEVDVGFVGDVTGAMICCERDGPWLKLLSCWCVWGVPGLKDWLIWT